MLDTLKKATPETLDAIQEELRIRHTNELFLLFPMGSQFDHLIYQDLSKLGVYCLVADPASVTVEDVIKIRPTGIIISGGPASMVNEPPSFDYRIFDYNGSPTLGICLGFQMWAEHVGFEVIEGESKEFGTHDLYVTNNSGLLEGFPLNASTPVLQSHGDQVALSDKMTLLGSTTWGGTTAAVSAASFGHLHGVQFHPEVTETELGMKIFENFCFGICGAQDRFPADNISKRKIQALSEQIGDRRVLLALSGGSDSSVVAYLLKHATKGRHQLRGVYIKGIDRPDDEAFVLEYFGNQPWIELVVVDATDGFLEALAGKMTMKEKRIAMRSVYKPILEGQAAEFAASFIAQGTLYTDLSESGHGKGGARKAQIKLHHNTGLDFSLPEITPLDDCVKDGGRSIGREIGVPEELLIRHPFPGPGQVVRVDGEVTADRLAMVRQCDGIWIEELRRAGFYELVWQAGATVLSSVHTCTKGDDASFGPIVMLWAVNSVNGFTARWASLPEDFLGRVSTRITNEVRGAGAVVYRISDKPPTTIELG